MMKDFEDDVCPEVNVDGVPFCSDRCPNHDGKRCAILGRRPGNICEPAVIQIQRELGKAYTSLLET